MSLRIVTADPGTSVCAKDRELAEKRLSRIIRGRNHPIDGGAVGCRAPWPQMRIPGNRTMAKGFRSVEQIRKFAPAAEPANWC
jgi:hypothetical protein